jgi:glycosyltransferase involved in cell wall biosynthesis
MTEARPRVVLYSDCPVFGGADSLAAYLLADAGLKARFDLSFVYRDNPRFSAGAARRGLDAWPNASVVLADRMEWIEALESRVTSPLGRLAAKALFRLAEPLVFLHDVARLYAVFSGQRPELIHINNGGYPGALGCRAAVLAARLAGARKAVFVVHNLAHPRKLPAELLDAVLDPAVDRAVDAFVTASTISQDALAGRGFPREKMTIIPDGVPTPASLRSPAVVRRELGLGETDAVFVTTAFFEPRKGHRVLVEAAAALALPGNVKFVLIGDGPELEPVKSAVAAAGLVSSFRFLGFRGDAAEILAAADALILPSVSDEDMPLAILDAMALGKPVLSTRLAGIPDEVEDGKTGLLSEPGDAKGLAENLGRLIKDPALRRSLGAAGRARFLERFDAAISARRYSELYARLLA